MKSPALIRTGAILVFVLVLHTLDHALRQDRSLGAAVVIPGLSGQVGAVLALGMAIAGHRLAPAAGVIIGAGTALGFVAVHLLPHWSAFSDPYSGLGLDWISWASVFAGIAAGAAFAVAGWRALPVSPRLARAR
jgi:hypothetical protein